jgi:hypothetical protein
MPQTFRGKTEDAEAPFLGAEFWEVGKSVSGKVVKLFQVKPDATKEAAQCYVIEVDGDDVMVDGEPCPRVSVGNLAGFKMAMQVAGLQSLHIGDTLELECTGVKPPTKEGYSPRLNFTLTVIR